MNRRALRVVAPAALTLTMAATPTADAPIPAPEATLGFAPCADFKLATSERISEYLHRLDAASDRIAVLDIGRTTEGRRQELAVISSAENLRRLGHYKGIARNLALNRDESGRPLTDAGARALAREGKAMVWVNFGLHSDEAAHTQTAPLFAWTMVAGETAEVREIRENVILLVLPDANPDGTTMIADWYAAQRGTPWEMRLPTLYHRYAGHDNNRDWYMFTQVESRNIARQLYEEFFPQIVYDQHQTAPFPARIFVPPFADPTNVNIPPLVRRGINTIGQAISRRLASEGKTGAISRVAFDAWWNGGMRTAPYFHNMIGILTETGHASPTPAEYDASTFPRHFANGRPTLEPSADYPHPYRGGTWRFRQSCEYMLSASLAVASAGARQREAWQYDVYRMAHDAIREGARETYVVPDEQWDSGAMIAMINTLARGGVQIERATAAFAAGSHQYGAGTFVIRGAQPFLPYVRDLLNPQQYVAARADGEDGAEPYDLTGWTLHLQMGVRVDKVAGAVTAPTEVVRHAGLRGSLTGSGTVFFALDARHNNSFIAVNRLLGAGADVRRTTCDVTIDGRTWPAGTFVVPRNAASQSLMPELVEQLGLTAVAANGLPPTATAWLTLPRTGVYSAWGGNADEGWTRWVLEQFEFPYSTVRDQDVRAGGLRRRFDVILLPDATYREMVEGVAQGDLPDQYTGGMTRAGEAHLREFVANGGVLIAQDHATELPIRAFGLTVGDSTGFTVSPNAPGSLLRISVNPLEPLAWGMPPEAAAFSANSPSFSVVNRPSARSAAVYPEKSVLLSGWLGGERYLRNRTAVADVRFGKGRVALLGLRAQHRGQSHGTFKLLFNAIYLQADVQ